MSLKFSAQFFEVHIVCWPLDVFVFVWDQEMFLWFVTTFLRFIPLPNIILPIFFCVSMNLNDGNANHCHFTFLNRYQAIQFFLQLYFGFDIDIQEKSLHQFCLFMEFIWFNVCETNTHKLAVRKERKKRQNDATT